MESNDDDSLVVKTRRELFEIFNKQGFGDEVHDEYERLERRIDAFEQAHHIIPIYPHSVSSR